MGQKINGTFKNFRDLLGEGKSRLGGCPLPPPVAASQVDRGMKLMFASQRF